MKWSFILLVFVALPALAGPPAVGSGPIFTAQSIGTTDSSHVATLLPPKSMLPFSISISGLGTLNPKPDITPEESTWLNIMLSVGLTYGGIAGIYADYQPDYAQFVKLHHLERHFNKAAPSTQEGKP